MYRYLADKIEKAKKREIKTQMSNSQKEEEEEEN